MFAFLLLSLFLKIQFSVCIDSCTKHSVSSTGTIEVACGYRGIRNDPPVLEEPPRFSSTDGNLEVTLDVREVTAKAPGLFEFRARSICDGSGKYPCKGFVGPTIAVKPGDTLTIKFRNKLSNEVSPADSKAPIVNLHTHGLHIDPAIDNVYLEVVPGESHTYSFKIPDDHPAGLSWYHAHTHGAAALHVAEGILGALEVVGTPGTEGSTPDPSLSVDSTLLVLTHVSLCSCDSSTGAFRISSISELAREAHDTLKRNEVVSNPDGVSDAYIVNGQFQPRLNVKAGRWRVLSLVNGVGDAYLELEVRSEANGQGQRSCELKLLSIDGIWLDSPRSIEFHLMAPGNRASLAIMCDGISYRRVYLQSNPQNRAAGPEASFAQVLVIIDVDVDANAPASADPLPAALNWVSGSLQRPAFLSDLRSKAPSSRWEVGVQAGRDNWLGVGSDCGSTRGPPDSSGQCPHLVFGGAAMHYRHKAALCSIEELTYHARGFSKTVHPMHIHVNHFQVISAADEASFALWGEVGDWRDTVPALPGGVTVRYALDAYGAVAIHHCHWLIHEDRGMMSRFWIGDTDSGACTVTGGGNTGDPIEYCDADVPKDGFVANYSSVLASCDGKFEGSSSNGDTSNTYNFSAGVNISINFVNLACLGVLIFYHMW